MDSVNDLDLERVSQSSVAPAPSPAKPHPGTFYCTSRQESFKLLVSADGFTAEGAEITEKKEDGGRRTERGKTRG